MKAYYYVVCSDVPGKPYMYFKSNNKKVIKEYLKSIHVSFNMICDPTDHPIECGGINYIDLTKKQKPA